jgi:hypothetical protein
MIIRFKSLIHSKTHSFVGICGVVTVLQFGALASSAQTNQYLFTGSKRNITLNPGIYKITAYGAQGGTCPSGPGGLGAEMEAEFSFSGLTTLTLLVGGGGARNPAGGSGGGAGGGSFVVNGTVPLLVAGGGGGSAVGSGGGPGLTGTSGAGSSGPGGTNGTGGGIGQYGGGGGGGYLTGGGAPDALSGFPGISFLSGGYGGPGNFYGGAGGYGGGAGGGYSGGGGGGGYSGGGGGRYGVATAGGGGGGGGSYISSNAIAIIAEVSGIASPDGSPNGEIIITAIPVTLSYQVIDGKLVLAWAQGTLLSAGTVNGTYTPVNGASSPYTNSMADAQQYFRVLIQ